MNYPSDMGYQQSRELLRSWGADLIIFDSLASTNATLRELSLEDAPEFTVVLTEHQLAGKGRLDRKWESVPGAGIALSVLLKPLNQGLSPDSLTWFPLLTGLAALRAVRHLAEAQGGNTGVQYQLKWPNDLLIEAAPESGFHSGKFGGILGEITPDYDLVMGIGLNISHRSEQLPVATASSLSLGGVKLDAAQRDSLVVTLLEELRQLILDFCAQASRGNTETVRELLSPDIATLNQQVKVIFPDGREEIGTALGLSERGELLFRPGQSRIVNSISVGDIVHLRPVSSA